MFALASLVHLTLPDFEQAGWLIPAIIEGVGALWLLIRPHRAAFAICAVGTLWPLLFGRDVLTQSALLTIWALVALIGRGDRLAAVRMITAATYGFAALHKINSAFFDPAYSCGHHAWAQIAERYALPDLGTMPWLPWFIVLIEIALAVGIWRRAPWVWPLGIAFHLPLTVTLAPAFGAVMIAGWSAALTPRQVARWRQVRWSVPVVGAVALGLGEILFGDPQPFLLVKVMVAGALLTTSLAAWQRPRGHTRAGAFAWAALAVWCLNCLTPYLGVQYQHSAAMLSNLRIDRGCHNSLVIPESLRLVEPYIRIDHARFGAGLKPERVERVQATLWNLPALATMHRNWCIPEHRPLVLAGTWHGQPFRVPDLCAEDWQTHLPGAEGAWLGYQRYQKNLLRECPTACVH